MNQLTEFNSRIALPEPVGQRDGQVAVKQFELAEIFRILNERRKIVLASAVLGLLAAIALSLLITPLYRASGLLELNSATADAIERAQGDTRGDAVQAAELITTQAGILTSESLARRVAEDLNLAAVPEYGGVEGTNEQRVERATEAVMNNTLVDGIRNSLLIRISHTSQDPVLAARITNALMKSYIASSLERRFDSSSYARDFLEEQLARTKAALERSELELNNYAIDSGIIRAPGQIVNGQQTEGPTISVETLSALNTALNEARVNRIEAEQAFRNAPAVTTQRDAVVAPLLAQLAALEAEYEEKGRLFQPDYPEMRQLEARIDRLRASIREERGRSSSGERQALQAAYNAARNAEIELERRVAGVKGDIQAERTKSIQYTILQREADTNREQYDALLQRYKEIGVAGGIGQSNISLIDRAAVPQEPFRPNFPLNLALGLVLGLAAGIGAAFVFHILFDNISDPHDIRAKLHLPVLGVIPKEAQDRTLFEALADRKSEVSEAYISTATALKFIGPSGLPKSLVLTSSRPGEGKSTSSFALAGAAARMGLRTLLIDADLRKPTFVGEANSTNGFAHLLLHDEPLADYIVPTQTDNLHLLPVGRFTSSEAELLASARLKVVIDQAEKMFDFVVIDGPPVLGFADAPLLGAAAEAAVIVIESRASRTATVTEMIRRLGGSGTEIMGAILTKVSRSGSSYGYYSYSYSYGYKSEQRGAVSSDERRTIDLRNKGS